MSNNKESSVEWYIIERHTIEIQSRLGLISPIEYDAKLIKIEEQAKAMHKEECIKYYVDGVDYGDMGQHIRESLIQIAEKIYNETFGGNNEQQ